MFITEDPTSARIDYVLVNPPADYRLTMHVYRLTFADAMRAQKNGTEYRGWNTLHRTFQLAICEALGDDVAELRAGTQ